MLSLSYRAFSYGLTAITSISTMRSSSMRSPLFDFGSNLVDGSIGGERCALLPSDEMAGMVAGEVDAAVRFEQPLDDSPPKPLIHEPRL